MANEVFDNREINIPDNGSVSFNVNAFDSFVRSQGVTLTHYIALACPVGLIDQDDVARRPHEDHEGCSNGFIYIEAGDITGLFVSNDTRKKDMGAGLGDASGVRVTLPRFYDDSGCSNSSTPILVAPFDRFYLKEDAGLEVVHWQKHTANASGVDRLSFPVKQPIVLIDSHGKRYVHGQDYDITANGWIKWRLNHAPPVDPVNNKGCVYSIRYTYRPYYYVSNLPHEIRVAQIVDPQSGDRTVERMPQTVVLQREYNFLSQGSENPQDSASVRQQYLPPSNSFGPR